jgi:hypothetical protein
VGHQIYVNFEKFDVVQALLSFFFLTLFQLTVFYFILLFSFSKCPLLLIKVDFDCDFVLNKYSLRAYLQSFPTTYTQEHNYSTTPDFPDFFPKPLVKIIWL